MEACELQRFERFPSMVPGSSGNVACSCDPSVVGGALRAGRAANHVPPATVKLSTIDVGDANGEDLPTALVASTRALPIQFCPAGRVREAVLPPVSSGRDLRDCRFVENGHS